MEVVLNLNPTSIEAIESISRQCIGSIRRRIMWITDGRIIEVFYHKTDKSWLYYGNHIELIWLWQNRYFINRQRQSYIIKKLHEKKKLHEERNRIIPNEFRTRKK